MLFYYSSFHYYTHVVATMSQSSETLQVLTLESRNAENQCHYFCTG